MKSETYGVLWHVDPESKTQLVNCELSPKFPLGHSSLPDIRAIYAYIFWSLLFFLLLHAKLPFHLNVLDFSVSHFTLVALEILKLGVLQIHI